jgi:hypothetical protein
MTGAEVQLDSKIELMLQIRHLIRIWWLKFVSRSVFRMVSFSSCAASFAIGVLCNNARSFQLLPQDDVSWLVVAQFCFSS